MLRFVSRREGVGNPAKTLHDKAKQLRYISMDCRRWNAGEAS
jgi:hypothetical protein